MCSMFSVSPGLFDLFVLRSRDILIHFVRHPLNIIEKLTRDETCHSTQRMCRSSSCAHFRDFQRIIDESVVSYVACVLVVGGFRVGSERRLSREGDQHGDSGGSFCTFCRSAFDL